MAHSLHIKWQGVSVPSQESATQFIPFFWIILLAPILVSCVCYASWHAARRSAPNRYQSDWLR